MNGMLESFYIIWIDAKKIRCYKVLTKDIDSFRSNLASEVADEFRAFSVTCLITTTKQFLLSICFLNFDLRMSNSVVIKCV
jgi:hypothetical protein